jgi:hypothetical protein
MRFSLSQQPSAVAVDNKTWNLKCVQQHSDESLWILITGGTVTGLPAIILQSVRMASSWMS